MRNEKPRSEALAWNTSHRGKAMIQVSHFREQSHQTTQSRRIHHFSAIAWFWQTLGITAFICLGLASESLAQANTSPTSLTYYAEQGAANPPNQTLTINRSRPREVRLMAIDNVTWLTMTVSSGRISATSPAQIIVAVDTSGLAAGTYNANIRIRMGQRAFRNVPVTLIVSPPTVSPPSTTSSATITWNEAPGTSVSGYKVYVGEAPRLYTQTIDVGNVTSSIVKDLAVGRMYYFAVTAYNGAGESAPSEEASKTIQ